MSKELNSTETSLPFDSLPYFSCKKLFTHKQIYKNTISLSPLHISYFSTRKEVIEVDISLLIFRQEFKHGIMRLKQMLLQIE